MKKIIFLLSIICFALPTFAQYSTASVSGPWIITDGSQPTYLMFDGNGNINEAGVIVDSLYPIGIDSVSPSGAIYLQMNLIIGPFLGQGQMLNDSSADIHDTIPSQQVGQDIYIYKVLNPGALSGEWSGTVYDSNSNFTRYLQLTVNSSGTITAAIGIPLVAGRIFAGRDTFAGYITSTDASCAYRAIQLWGIFSGDSLIGVTQMGPFHNNDSNCIGGGYVRLMRTSSSIADIPAIDFSVYPNPFTDQIEISVSNPGNKMQADLYDLYGRKVLSRSLGTGQHTSLDAGILGSGIYILALTGTDGKTSAKKVIKN